MLVVGYGKSACDVTVPISETAASTTVVARQMLWKVPRKVAGVVNFKMLLLTRMGEALFRYLRLRGMEKFLHGPGNGARRRLLNGLGTVSVRQFGLRKLGLVPPGQMEDIVRGAIGLATEGFFEGVADGRIDVRRDCTITAARSPATAARSPSCPTAPRCPPTSSSAPPGSPRACRSSTTPCSGRLLDTRDNFLLYRQILPLGVPGLYFNGYNSSFFSPLNAEMAAVWIAADLAGAAPLPDPEDDARARWSTQLAFMDEATERAPLPRREDHPLLVAQRGRGARRPRPQHPGAGPGDATGSTRWTRRRTGTSRPRWCAGSDRAPRLTTAPRR